MNTNIHTLYLLIKLAFFSLSLENKTLKHVQALGFDLNINLTAVVLVPANICLQHMICISFNYLCCFSYFNFVFPRKKKENLIKKCE